jgi:CDP-glucose 4,6-dehydratase
VEQRQGTLEGVVVTPGWWNGRRVFVTGHTGFKGAWLCMLLRHLGARVHGYSLPPPTEPSLFKLARLHEIAETVTGDVRDLDALKPAVQQSGAEIVIHMAAQSLVRESYRDPVGTYATNAMGTVNVLEAVRSAGDQVRAVVIVTTDKCYENREWVWGYRENEPMGGHDPYSNSKGCAELVTASYRASFFAKTKTAVASARAGNVIGGGDWAPDRLIPDMIRAFAAHKPVVIRSPRSIRPWQLVLEPLAGYLALAERLHDGGQSFAEPFNFGPRESDARPVEWIVNRLVHHWGGDARWEIARGDQPHEAHHLKLDASKAAARLGWTPRTDLGLALNWITDWYKAYGASQDMRSVSTRQISEFLNLSASVDPVEPGAEATVC